MFCRKCGCQLADNATSCANCGTATISNGEIPNKEVTWDKPYLSVTEFVNSPYGESVKKDYKIVCGLSIIAQVLAVLLWASLIVILFVATGSDPAEAPPMEFVWAATGMSIAMAILGIWVMGQPRKKMTTGSCVVASVVGWFVIPVFGTILGVVMYSYVEKVEAAYNKFLYT